ncbi:hypothetical protein TIFTF001_031764 [Ficus carica]|uniref:Uncharacterized protein n=1 Tax=Ficus carica TaxID=3494 RepID=A0AA88J5L1_FICCA|nr:hypothetical protein TIFTF001_031764 [Ficus carica]
MKVVLVVAINQKPRWRCKMHRSNDEKRSTDLRKKRRSENLNGEKRSKTDMKIAGDRAKNRRKSRRKSREPCGEITVRCVGTRSPTSPPWFLRSPGSLSSTAKTYMVEDQRSKRHLEIEIELLNLELPATEIATFVSPSRSEIVCDLISLLDIAI